MKRIAIITYHYVRPIKGSLYPGIIGLELNKFRKQLNYIQSKYKILDYDSFLQILKSKKKISSNYCLLTFDDGYKDHVKYVLPELNKRKIKGFFFPPSILFNNKKILNVNKVHFLIEKKIDPKIIKDKILTLIHKKKKYLKNSIINLEKNFKNKDRFDNKNISFIKYLLQVYLDENLSNYIVSKLFKYFLKINEKKLFSDLYMNKKDLKKMINAGMYIGGHGYNHIHLNNLKSIDQKREIKKNTMFLKSIGSPTKDWIMCYPYGSYNNNLINILKKEKCICAFTTKKGYINIRKNNYFKLNRLDTNDIKY